MKALTESVNSWKGLWEASTQEIRELKMEIKELRAENDKLRTEIIEIKELISIAVFFWHSIQMHRTSEPNRPNRLRACF